MKSRTGVINGPKNGPWSNNKKLKTKTPVFNFVLLFISELSGSDKRRLVWSCWLKLAITQLCRGCYKATRTGHRTHRTQLRSCPTWTPCTTDTGRGPQLQPLPCHRDPCYPACSSTDYSSMLATYHLLKYSQASPDHRVFRHEGSSVMNVLNIGSNGDFSE